jgi:hypothetical protein
MITTGPYWSSVINPDGRDRHTFVDAKRGELLVADPNDREHNEVGLVGRTTIIGLIWNRDWYLAVIEKS